MVFPDLPGHVERLRFLSQVWGEKSDLWISCSKVAETKCWHFPCLQGPLYLQSSDWMTETACKDEDVLSEKRPHLDKDKRLTANFTNLCQTHDWTDVGTALFSCGPSAHRRFVWTDRENVSRSVLRQSVRASLESLQRCQYSNMW